MSECVCPLAGYCDTHKRTMSELRHRQCRDEPGYYEAFQLDLKRAATKQWKPREKTVATVTVREPEPLLTPADLPCVHRGEFIETVGCVPCQSRGRSGADVFACAKHGRSMIHNFAPRDSAEKAVACVTCEDRPDAGEA